MNIKVKAAAQVALFIVAAMAAGAAARVALNLLAAAYGEQTVLDGVCFVLLATAAYVLVGLLYDIRVAQLQYKAKLTDMIKK
jgi:hypothetical protein